MGLIVDCVLEALESRLLGSGDFDTEIKSLDTALTLQFRLHYHLFGKGVSVVVGQVLRDECGKLKSELKSTHQRSIDQDIYNLILKIVYNVGGMLEYHLNNLEEAKRLLSKAADLGTSYEKFAICLDLENLYYRGLCADDTSIYAQQMPKILNHVPLESQGITWHYIHLIFKSLGEEGLKCLPRQTPLTFLAHLFAGSCDESELLDFAAQLLKGCKFPESSESNNDGLIQFHTFLQYFFRMSKTISSNWRSFMVASMEKTFQSVEVSKSSMIFFARHSRKPSIDKESLLNFVNYVRYTERNFVINGGKYDDVMAFFDSYGFILDMFEDGSQNVENIFDLDESLKSLLGLLESFYEKNHFSMMSESDSLNWLENSSKLVLPMTVSSTLSNAWKTLYRHRKTSLDHLLQNQLTFYVSNAMCVELNSSSLCDLQFQYAFLLAQKRLVLPASKILKTVILEEDPECYKAWHLLALCESIREDKEASLKIVCSVLEAMKESFTEKKLTKVDRWQYIQLKLTQLSLIEEIFGTMDALEMLPEAFELYASLFPEGTKEFDSIGKAINQSKEYLLQLIWIFAANMYLRLSDKALDCKNAIKEADNVTDSYKNLNCNIANGYLYLVGGKLKKSLKEFETVLFYDQYNVNAMLGLAEIVFPSDESQSESSLQDYYELVPKEKHSSSPKVFVNALDESAATARLKFLLEYSTTKSIEAYYSPDVWWYLSTIYGRIGDEGYKEALLNCIRYQETMPVREFKFCNF